MMFTFILFILTLYTPYKSWASKIVNGSTNGVKAPDLAKKPFVIIQWQQFYLNINMDS